MVKIHRSQNDNSIVANKPTEFLTFCQTGKKGYLIKVCETIKLSKQCLMMT